MAPAVPFGILSHRRDSGVDGVRVGYGPAMVGFHFVEKRDFSDTTHDGLGACSVPRLDACFPSGDCRDDRNYRSHHLGSPYRVLVEEGSTSSSGAQNTEHALICQDQQTFHQQHTERDASQQDYCLDCYLVIVEASDLLHRLWNSPLEATPWLSPGLEQEQWISHHGLDHESFYLDRSSRPRWQKNRTTV